MKPKLSETLSESQIQRQILDWLQLKGVFCWRVNTGAMRGEYKGKPWFVRFGMPGVADIIGILPGGTMRTGVDTSKSTCTNAGRFLAVEVKSAKGKLSAAQESFRDAVLLNGGKFILARSLDDVIRELDGK